jgi:hypothetical protein
MIRQSSAGGGVNVLLCGVLVREVHLKQGAAHERAATESGGGWAGRERVKEGERREK